MRTYLHQQCTEPRTALGSASHDRALSLQEARTEVNAAAVESATAEVAPSDAEVAPAADKEESAGEVTSAAVDSAAATSGPIAEAVVALQEVMDPAPVPEPVVEGEGIMLMLPVS